MVNARSGMTIAAMRDGEGKMQTSGASPANTQRRSRIAITTPSPASSDTAAVPP